jgi:deazaflavin-dependent oxidoreductase (nitroreductase family)
MSRMHARLYLLSGGRFGRRWFAGAPVMVLQTIGRRSGEVRCAPVLYLRDGDRFVVMAANAGADRTPGWWLNLRAAGVGEAIVGHVRVVVRPRVLVGDERDRSLRAFVEMYPQAEQYSTFTTRDLPLIALEPGRT